MSTPFAEAMPDAEFLRTTLEPFCERIAIAGSLRRGCASVNDIEILFIPKFAAPVQPESVRRWTR